MATDLNRSIKIFIDNSDAQLKATQLEAKIQELNASLEQLAATGQTDTASYAQKTTAYNQATSSLTKYQTSVADTTRVLNNLSGATYNELSNMSKTISKDLKTLSLDSDEYRDKLVLLQAVEKERSAAMDQMHNKSGQQQSDMTKMIAIGSLIGNAALQWGQQALSAIGHFIGSSIELAAKTEGIQRAFDGLNNPHLLDNLQKATEGTVDKITLMQEAVKADHFKIPLNELSDILKFVKTRAEDTGESFDDLAQRALQGFGTQMPRSFTKLGISVTELRDKTKEMGSVGAAAYAIIQESLQKTAGYQDTAEDKQSRYEATLKNFQLSLGQLLLPIKKVWVEWTTSLVKGMEDMTKGTKPAIESFKDQLNVVSDLTVHIEPLLDRYDVLTKKTNLSKTEHQELSSIISQVTNQIPGAATAFDRYGKAISISTGYARDFINQQIAMLQYMHADAYNQAQKDEKNSKQAADAAQATLDESKRPGYTWQVRETTPAMHGSAGSSSMRQATQDEIADAQKKLNDLIAIHKTAADALDGFAGTTLKKMQAANDAKVAQEDAFNKMTKKQLADYIQMNKDAKDKYVDIAKETYDARFSTLKDGKATGGTGDDSSDMKALNLITETLETKHQERINAIKEQYKSGDIKSESNYNGQLMAEDYAYYTLKEKALTDYLKKTKDPTVRANVEKQIAEMHQKRLDEEIAYRAKIQKIVLDADPVKAENESYQEQLRDVGLFNETKEDLLKKIAASNNADEKQNLQDQLTALELLEKKHNDNLFNIQKNTENEREKQSEDAFEKSFSERKAQLTKENSKEEASLTLQKGIGALSPLQSFNVEEALQKKKIAAINEELAARKKAGLDTTQINKELSSEELKLTQTYIAEYNRRTKLYGQFGAQIGDALGDLITGNESALKTSMANLIDLALEQLKADAEIAIAKSTFLSVSTEGLAGIGQAAILTALIEGACAAAETVVKSTMSGSSSSSSTSSTVSSSSARRVLTQATGKYDVIGAAAGKMYKNIPYVGTPQTGVVKQPTLIAEDGGEMVISSPDLSRLQRHINYPLVVEAINDARTNRVPQRASGKYDVVQDNYQTRNMIDTAGTTSDPELKIILARLANHLDKGIATKFSFYQYDLQRTIYDNSLKEGSRE